MGVRTCSHVPNVMLVAVAKIRCYNGAVLDWINFEVVLECVFVFLALQTGSSSRCNRPGVALGVADREKLSV